MALERILDEIIQAEDSARKIIENAKQEAKSIQDSVLEKRFELMRKLKEEMEAEAKNKAKKIVEEAKKKAAEIVRKSEEEAKREIENVRRKYEQNKRKIIEMVVEAVLSGKVM